MEQNLSGTGNYAARQGLHDVVGGIVFSTVIEFAQKVDHSLGRHLGDPWTVGLLEFPSLKAFACFIQRYNLRYDGLFTKVVALERPKSVFRGDGHAMRSVP